MHRILSVRLFQPGLSLGNRRPHKAQAWYTLHRFHVATVVSTGICVLRFVFRYVERWKAHTGVPGAPMVVQCADATTQSGLFCTCYVICEKWTLEGHVSVFHTVKALRLKQPCVIASLVNIPRP